MSYHSRANCFSAGFWPPQYSKIPMFLDELPNIFFYNGIIFWGVITVLRFAESQKKDPEIFLFHGGCTQVV
jgi:hypothetical protein